MAEKRENFPYGNLNIFTEAVTLILDKLDDIAAGGGGGGQAARPRSPLRISRECLTITTGRARHVAA